MADDSPTLFLNEEWIQISLPALRGRPGPHWKRFKGQAVLVNYLKAEKARRRRSAAHTRGSGRWCTSARWQCLTGGDDYAHVFVGAFAGDRKPPQQKSGFRYHAFLVLNALVGIEAW
ncbi:unnamed protein product [Miscanthus lutarioriparius]|uniref:Uncharacterized protein n=1 Tax=Miscanthus lutarioriparius TaxID=422564 RepID=A0A811NR29_9POAL|nr:unnamed protein product [Miscanthus lutarioriparius]